MRILNFTHNLSDARLDLVEQITNRTVEFVVDLQIQFDAAQPFAEQTRLLVDGILLSASEWQTLPLLVNLPSHNVIAALILGELHGWRGCLTAVIRLRPIENIAPPQFEVTEIINLQAVRERARWAR